MFSALAKAYSVTAGAPANASGAFVSVGPDTQRRGDLVLATDPYIEGCNALRDEELIAFADDDSEDVHNTNTADIATQSAEFGVINRLSVNFALPFIIWTSIREADHHEGEPEIEQLGSAAGVGDLQIERYVVFRRAADDIGVSLLAAHGIPTGVTQKLTNDGLRIEAEVQPRSGSWGPELDLAISRAFGPVSATVSAL